MFFFEDCLVKSISGDSGDGSIFVIGEISFCEVDRIEMEYFKGFYYSNENSDDEEVVKRFLCVFNSLLVDMSLNIVYNFIMFYCGFIIKFLL